MSLTPEEAGMVGGSDLPGILGRSPWATPLSVYARIVAALEGRHQEQAPNAAMSRGNHLEAAVLAMYAEETGAVVTPRVSLRWGAMPYVRGSLDAVANRDGRRVVEVKTAGLTEIRQWGEDGTDEIPEGYIFQTTWYAGLASTLGVVDTPEVDVAALVAGDLRVYHIPFDVELYNALEYEVAKFWTDHVEPRRPPPVTEPFQDLAAVGHLYRKHTSDAKHWDTLTPEGQVAVSEYLRAKEEEALAAGLRASWEVRAKLELGVAPQLVGLPEHLPAHRIDWKQNKAGTVTDWATAFKDLSAYSNAKDVRHAVKMNTTTKEGARPFVARRRGER